MFDSYCRGALTLLIICVLGEFVSATTEAGSIIRNQAEATYFDPASDRSFHVTSTIATVRVKSAPDFVFLNDNEIEASPDELIAFPHLLTNTGNEIDRYNLSLLPMQAQTELLDRAIHIDLNENGSLDPDEPAISVTDNLVPGQSVSLLLCGRIPPLATPGQDFVSEIQASSLADPANVQTRRDRAFINVSTPFKIIKSSFPPCATPVSAGSLIDYNINLLNLSELKPHIKTYDIDGEPQIGFIIEDVIPANTNLVAGTAERVSPRNGRMVIRRPGAGQDSFENYGRHKTGDIVVSVGLFIPLSEMRDDQSGRFSFQVEVNDDITPGITINNTIHVDLDGDGVNDVASNQTCNTVAPGGQGLDAQLSFLEPSPEIRQQITQSSGQAGDQNTGGAGIVTPRHTHDPDYADAKVYRLDNYPGYILSRDGVYLQARSNAMNTQGYSSESTYAQSYIRVRVQSQKTGDSLNMRLLETGPNTGLFRAEVPFRLSASEAGQGRDCGPNIVEQCVMRSQSGDKLQATIFDPGVQFTLEDFAVVDPTGIVFDSTSLAPVPGAQVTFIQDSGAPAIDPDTGSPFVAQTTGETGEYTIPRLSSGLYHVRVETPESYSFPSIVAPDVFAGRRTVDDRSYGLNGFDGAAGKGLFHSSFQDVPPVLDIPIDPDLSLGQLSLDKEVDRQTVNFGDTLTYTLTTRNGTNAVLLDVKVSDQPPAGFRYVDGSATLNGAPLTIQRGPNARGLIFPVGRLEVGETATINYRLQVGPDARPGDAVNTAVTTGRTGGLVPATSFTARQNVKVSDEGLLSDKAYIIGAVWVDINADGHRDEGEIGVPGVRIWLDDGSWVVSDATGRYSIYGLESEMRIARLDDNTFSDELVPISTEARQFKGGLSRFVDLSSGELHRADFPLICKEPKSCASQGDLIQDIVAQADSYSSESMLDEALAYEGLIGETQSLDRAKLREVAGVDGDISSGRISGNSSSAVQAPVKGGVNADAEVAAHADLDPEVIATQLGSKGLKAGDWVWPAADIDDQPVISRDGRFIVVVRAGLRPTLFVDGAQIDESRLGALIESKVEGATVAAWYGVDMDAGEHLVEVKAEDMFGNVRVLAKQDVVRPGDGVSLRISPGNTDLMADGQTRNRIKVQVLDAQSVPALGTEFVTVLAERIGDIDPLVIETLDVQPNEPGHQIRIKNGEATIDIRSPEKAGIVRITADNGSGNTASADVTFRTPMQDLMVVGLFELSGQVNQIDGKLAPTREGDYPENLDVNGRGSFFLKGRIKGDMLLTAAYDSKKSREDGLFRDIDPEAYYPIYGDASEKGFEAQSRSKVYVRLEKNDASVMWGDYRSDAFAEDSLTRMRRSFTGANAVYKSGNKSVQVFGAEVRDEFKSERIRGKGTALNYVLPGAPLVRNSEVLSIEVRDRDNPGLVISDRPLTRFADYLLDDETGRLIMKFPIPSIDEKGNPVFLIARYEVQQDAKAGIVAGVRANITSEKGRVWAGANYDESEQGIDHKITSSVGAEYQSAKGRVWAEVGHMTTETQAGTKDSGEAFRVGAEGQLLDGQIRAEFAQADAGFDNQDAPILSGRREARAEYSRNVGKNLSLSSAVTYSEDLSAVNKRVTGEALIEGSHKAWSYAAGPRYTSENNANGDNEFFSGVLRLERSLELINKAASVHIEVEQAIGDDRTRVQFGGDILVRDDMRLYANHRILDELPDQTFISGLTQNDTNLGRAKTVVGIETSLIPHADLYGEWRQTGILDGQTGEAAYGLRAQWEVLKGISLSPQLEFVNTFGGNGDPSAGALDSQSISVAIADSRFANSRRTARIEGRHTSASTYFGIRTGWAQKFSPTLSGALKVDASIDNITGSDNNDRIRVTAGMARRPLKSFSTDWFGVYQFLSENQAGVSREVNLVSVHANRQITRRLVMSGRLGGKWETAAGFNTSAQLIGAKVSYDFADDWSLILRGSHRMVGWGDASEFSAGAAVAWYPVDMTQLTLGYNFVGFKDADLDPKSYDAEGLYWQLAVAMDENWFGWLAPN